ncbi:PREDICTED: uncharacterized protein LOC109347406 [Lupinus angustifolius]|uniref:uncharacterized protein LOC109347406 n=1 Tax=Lupinus angustifolius TaxID=3871 RepID=UPI00092E68AE|nr:PREDICTED: uncharacterized protein LOC109347406 [Lupinus angustifolius]
MVLFQSSNFTLPTPSSLSSLPLTTSLSFEPTSLSLSLTHFDSSISLYPSFSISDSTLPQSQTLIPSPSSSSSFVLLRRDRNPDSTPRVVFIVAGPHRSFILLRFYILDSVGNVFYRPKSVFCGDCKDLRFEPNLGVLVNSKHGVSIRVSGSVNYFAMYSVSAAKVWVFALRIDDDDDGCGEVVRLMRCAVIECSRPVWSISVSFGMLLLGEENGVRVFGLRRLVKGKVKKVRNLNSKVPNGGVVRDYGKNGKHGVAVKQANVKQNGGACFMALKGKGVETKSISKIPISVKVISIQALSQRMFLMLDSDGDLHILSLSNSGIGVDITGHVRQLPHIMNVQNLAVLPDVSTMSQIVWISDGCHSVYLFNAMDVENALNEADGNDDDKKLMHLPVNHVLFSGEKIQDIICLASNSILILGQGSLYAYAIS